jgi:hypothetical protein
MGAVALGEAGGAGPAALPAWPALDLSALVDMPQAQVTRGGG